jgi:hypothetical protein
VAAEATPDPSDVAPLVAPPQDHMEILHNLAMAGNMREIRRQADQLITLDPRYRLFAETLKRLASAWRAPISRKPSSTSSTSIWTGSR